MARNVFLSTDPVSTNGSTAAFALVDAEPSTLEREAVSR
jgi:hypothetical protein